ncbi:MAG: hypothetical protein ABMA64_01450 [Myxococcota bacterium]
MLPLWLACTPDPTSVGDDDDDDVTHPSGDTGPAVTVDGLVSDARVALHPEMNTLLVATWTQGAAAEQVWLSWSFEGVEYASPPFAAPVGPAREVVLGLPAEVTVPLVLHVVVDGVESVVDLGLRSTAPLPGDLDDPAQTVRDDARARPEPWLLTSVDVGANPFFGPCYTVILDRAGRIVWYRPTTERRLTWQARVSRTGPHLLIDESGQYSPGEPTASRVSADLVLDEPIDLTGMGTALEELDDGSILFDEVQGYQQAWLTRQAPDGARTRLWDCTAWMAAYTDQQWACAANAIVWDAGRNTVLWSMFAVSTVAEIDLGTGAVVNEFGEYPGGHLFSPLDSAFDLQHMPNWTADGTLIASMHGQGGTEQWAREYTVDAQQLTQVWSARADEFAPYAGHAQKLPTGNVLWTIGTAGVIRELSRDGAAVWDAAWPGHLVGNSTPLADLYALTAPR